MRYSKPFIHTLSAEELVSSIVGIQASFVFGGENLGGFGELIEGADQCDYTAGVRIPGIVHVNIEGDHGTVYLEATGGAIGHSNNISVDVNQNGNIYEISFDGEHFTGSFGTCVMNDAIITGAFTIDASSDPMTADGEFTLTLIDAEGPCNDNNVLPCNYIMKVETSES